MTSSLFSHLIGQNKIVFPVIGRLRVTSRQCDDVTYYLSSDWSNSIGVKEFNPTMPCMNSATSNMLSIDSLSKANFSKGSNMLDLLHVILT